MLELGCEADLPLEALGPQARGQLGMQDLERHRAPVLEVAREEDRGHAPAPELALEDVAVTESGSQRSGEVGQGGRGGDAVICPWLGLVASLASAGLVGRARRRLAGRGGSQFERGSQGTSTASPSASLATGSGAP